MIVRGREWSRFAAAALGAQIARGYQPNDTRSIVACCDGADAMILERNRRDAEDARAAERKHPPQGIES